MTRYVSLACDANPHYSVYAPIVARLWRRLGFEPIVFMHTSGWDSPLGALVQGALDDDAFLTPRIPRIDPLSVGNTMRVVRIVAASLVDPAALVMTADVDMAPLSRTFFDRTWDQFVLRADMYGSLHAAPKIQGGVALIPGLWRFPLCYVGMRGNLWRKMLPIVNGDPETSLRQTMVGLRHDKVDYDEETTSARLLAMSPGELVQDAEDTWHQGDLCLVSMTDWTRDGWPKRMLIHGEGNGPVQADAIDFHMPRPTARWVGQALSQYWPEEADFILPYWQKVCGSTEVTN